MKFITAAIAFLVTASFWPGIAGAATTPRWAILAVMVAVAQFFVKPKLTLAHVILAVLLCWMAVSMLWSIVGYDWLFMMCKMLIIAGLFVVAAEIKNIEPLIAGCILGITVNSVVVIAQVNGWQGLGQLVPPGGLFLNRDIGSETAALLLIAIVYQGPRLWWGFPLVFPSFILPHSRGSVAAVVVVAVSALLRKWPKFIVIVSSIAIAVIALHYIVHTDGAIDERFDIWRDTIDGYRWLGNGLGQYYVTYPNIASRIDTLQQRPEHAHNDILELGYELGCGLLLVVAFLRSVWRGALPAERAVLLGFAVEGCFGFPLYMPVSAAIFAVMAGRLAGSGPSLRNDINDGRMVCFLWLEHIIEYIGRREKHRYGEEIIPAGIPQQERARLRVLGGDT